MSLPDELILKYMELLTDISQTDIDNHKKEMKAGKNPRDTKIILAKEIVAQYYNNKIAEKEEKNFESLFSKKKVHDDIPVINLFDKLEKKDSYTVFEITSTAAELGGINDSSSVTKRKIKQGGVSINNQKITNPFEKINLTDDTIIKYGKINFFRHKSE